MSTNTAAVVGENLPYLRRYARALTGSQETGDKYAIATLEALIAEPDLMSDENSPKVDLFRTFHVIWSTSGAPLGEAEEGLSKKAQAHLAKLTPKTREALLLSSIEGFSDEDIATIMEIDVDEARHLQDVALNEMSDSVAGRVMIIEDEAIIAMDLQTAVSEMGHEVTGVARTHREAVALASKDTPDLILADIQLADNSSGIDAVKEIMVALPDVPVVFITAFPERLLTGERPEPAFLITKPYSEIQVRSAVSQAMFFSSTETLLA